jgi:hypothetical protein
MVEPTAEQEAVEKLFPAVAQWVRDEHVEIGDQEGFGFVARALDYGGLACEDDRPNTLAEALAALERGLAEYFRRNWQSVAGCLCCWGCAWPSFAAAQRQKRSSGCARSAARGSWWSSSAWRLWPEGGTSGRKLRTARDRQTRAGKAERSNRRCPGCAPEA